LRRGDLVAADEGIRLCRERAIAWGIGSGAAAYGVAFHTETLVKRGDLAGAREALSTIGPLPPGTEAERLVLCARAQFALAVGDPEAALEAALAAGASAGMVVQPIWLPWRGLAAEALTALGRLEEAIDHASDELGPARAWGSPSAIGRVLRTLGEALGGEAGRAELRRSIAALDGSVARLELAQSLAALGRAELGAGEADAAIALLRRALAEAERCAAEPLAGEVRGLLAENGVAQDEPGRIVLLSDLERRVASTAARGLDVRATAQATFLTPAQVGRHLAAARAKLGVAEDAELGRALADQTA
jgi:tetratricopeptide (TPR) repeat protein